MAVTTTSTTLLKIQEGTLTGSSYPGFTKDGLRLGTVPFDFVQGAAAGDANSFCRLRKMPSGLHIVYSVIVLPSAFGSSRTLSVGYEAHTKSDGTTAVTADAVAFCTQIAVAAATLVQTSCFKEMDSLSGYVVVGFVEGGTIPAGATLKGLINYAY